MLKRMCIPFSLAVHNGRHMIPMANSGIENM